MRYVLFVMMLFLLLIVVGCTEQQETPETQNVPVPEPPSSDVDDPVEMVVVYTDGEPPVEEDTCEQWAEDLIPDYVTVHEGDTRCERILKGVWGDDEPVRIMGSSIEFIRDFNKRFKLEKGAAVGENSDLFYLKSYGNEYLNFGYEVKVVNSEGVIVGKREFEVKVKALGQRESVAADEIGCVWTNYTFVEPEITNCNQVSQS